MTLQGTMYSLKNSGALINLTAREKMKELKEYLGLHKDQDVVRFCITKVHRDFGLAKKNDNKP